MLKQKWISPIAAGALIGLLAVIAGEWGGIAPPENYGICTTCHTRDMVVGIASRLGWTDFQLISGDMLLWPLLTTLGIVLGAWLANYGNEESRVIKLPLRQIAASILTGFLVMSFALLAMGCPLRMILRTADLNLQGLIGLAGVALGGVLGIRWMKVRIYR